ncbi:hypothetical protein [Poseidonibacter sp.]|uniref:hypothetical protein n=1 Tax=Poseidonibacter sp. TaxID=2321188 RepID=UPI003C744B14
MERRNRSLKALSDLQYIDSLDSELRANQLLSWVEKNLSKNKIEDFDLDLESLKKLSELFYKNLNFLKNYRQSMKHQIKNQNKIREFLN